MDQERTAFHQKIDEMVTQLNDAKFFMLRNKKILAHPTG